MELEETKIGAYCREANNALVPKVIMFQQIIIHSFYFGFTDLDKHQNRLSRLSIVLAIVLHSHSGKPFEFVQIEFKHSHLEIPFWFV